MAKEVIRSFVGTHSPFLSLYATNTSGVLQPSQEGLSISDLYVDQMSLQMHKISALIIHLSTTVTRAYPKTLFAM